MPKKIKIIFQNWTGWTKEQPAPVEKEFDIVEGFDIPIKEIDPSSEASVKITKIENDLIEVLANDLVESRGHVDLHTPRINLTFTLKKGEELKLATPTMDAGFSITISIME